MLIVVWWLFRFPLIIPNNYWLMEALNISVLI